MIFFNEIKQVIPVSERKHLCFDAVVTRQYSFTDSRCSKWLNYLKLKAAKIRQPQHISFNRAFIMLIFHYLCILVGFNASLIIGTLLSRFCSTLRLNWSKPGDSLPMQVIIMDHAAGCIMSLWSVHMPTYKKLKCHSNSLFLTTGE